MSAEDQIKQIEDNLQNLVTHRNNLIAQKVSLDEQIAATQSLLNGVRLGIASKEEQPTED